MNNKNKPCGFFFIRSNAYLTLFAKVIVTMGRDYLVNIFHFVLFD